jgi:hypothetical protein
VASAEAQKPAGIAKTLYGAPQTVWNVNHLGAARDLARVPRGSNVPLRVEPVLHAEKRVQGRAIRQPSPRNVGKPARV